MKHVPETVTERRRGLAARAATPATITDARRRGKRPSARTACAVACLWLAAATYADADSDAQRLVQQRRDYLAALRALGKNDLTTFRRLRARLGDYVLRPYLDYALLRRRLARTPAEEIRRYLAENQEAATSRALRRRWLHHLARTGRWRVFMREYRDIPADTVLACYRLRRLLRTAEGRAEARPLLERLWRTSRSQPKACDPAFRAAHRHGLLDRELVWARIRLAMARGRVRLARYIGRHYLSRAERIWVERWAAMHRRPAQNLRRIGFALDTALAREIVRHGMTRLARRDAEAAMQRWTRLLKRHPALRTEDAAVRRTLGILAAKQHSAAAAQWLAALPPREGDAELDAWRLRAALRESDWAEARRLLHAGALGHGSPFWRYFKARVLEYTGESAGAQGLYSALARERSYYGFLAADRLGLPYAIHHQPVRPAPDELRSIAARPGIQMARELFLLGKTAAARRQWAWATRAMTARQLQVAAHLAARWGWHDRAIAAIGKSGHRDDLQLRFPMPYRDLIERHARRTRLDPEWIFGLVRQESAFVPDARSRAGALGLMQVMPRTGQRIGRRLKLRIRSRRAILKVENNVWLGTAYLKTVLEQHGGHPVLATAAYNAGPHRVRRWLPRDGALDADIWIETIPFDETREFVKNVMAFTAIYGRRLGKSDTRLRARMPPVPPARR